MKRKLAVRIAPNDVKPLGGAVNKIHSPYCF